MSSLDVKSHELKSLSDGGGFCGCDKVAVGGIALDWGRGSHFEGVVNRDYF